MALSQSRQVFQTDINCTVSGVAERGGILSFVPGVNGLCAYADSTAVSGQVANPAGLLLDDVENINYFRNPEFRQRNVVPLGSVVGVVTEGEFFTDFVETSITNFGSLTYSPGELLYLADDGKVSNLNVGGNRVQIGRALSAVDSNGFLKIRVEI
jgi:hypothetical protein